MPSFDIDVSTGPSSTLRGPAFESFGELRNSHDRANGTRSSQRKSTKNSQEQSSDSYFEGMNGDSITNGASPSSTSGHQYTNGSLNPTPNGRVSSGSWDNKMSRNGSVYSITGGVNGMNGHENGRKSPALPHGQPKPITTDRYTITANGGPVQPLSDTVKSSLSKDSSLMRKISIPGPISTNPQSTGPLTYNSSLYPNNPSSPKLEASPRAATSSPQPHRFSSPPAYPPPGIPHTAPSSSSGPNIHQGMPQLKHRHTLQVPKVGVGRGSRDGVDDSGYSTGRFSPTTATRRGSLSLNRRNTRSIHSEMPHEEVPLDEETMRWVGVVQKKRASKRKRRDDDEDDDRVVVGTKVDINHVNWITAYNMLSGIRCTVSRTNAKLDRPLTSADFEAKMKQSFDINGNELTPSAKYDFKFKDYAPWVFRHLRANFKIDPADYLMSLTSKYILSELGSPGKSGSFFYFSRDYKYIIKTIHHSEHKFLRKILKEYYDHVVVNPNTLLSQFYGLHRVKMPYGRKIHFVVMNNIFPPHKDIHQTFDLKGSTVGRDFKEEQLEKNPRATMKDLNWLRRKLHLEFGPDKRKAFFEQVERDVALLQKLHIMDYSLLVGIHDLEKGNQDNIRDKTLQVFQPGGDTQTDETGTPAPSLLSRTPSKMESMRKARELRQIIKQEKPVPMASLSSRMPDEMEENTTKRDFTFTSDDGGFQATHDDNTPGDEIYYLGIIDCLTHYGPLKRLEHFWKGLNYDKEQISPVPAQPYGSRFVQFIEGITKTREEAQRDEELQAAEENLIQTDAANGATDIITERPPRSQEMRRSESTNSVIRKAESAAVKSERRGGSEDNVPDKVLSTVDSPSGDRGAERGDTVLPIVDEAGESSSTGGRSRRSDSVEARPVTPPKDNVKSRNVSERARGDRSRGSSFNSNKALPELPREASSSTLNKAGKLRLRESMDSGHSSGSDTPWKLALRGVSNGRNETEV